MDKIAGPIITACWIIFIVYWIIGAVRVKTTAEHQSLPSALAHRLPVAFGYWLMIYSHLPPPMNLLLIPHTDLTLAAAAVVCVLGLLICLWARRTLVNELEQRCDLRNKATNLCAPARIVMCAIPSTPDCSRCPSARTPPLTGCIPAWRHRGDHRLWDQNVPGRTVNDAPFPGSISSLSGASKSPHPVDF